MSDMVSVVATVNGLARGCFAVSVLLLPVLFLYSSCGTETDWSCLGNLTTPCVSP